MENQTTLISTITKGEIPFKVATKIKLLNKLNKKYAKFIVCNFNAIKGHKTLTMLKYTMFLDSYHCKAVKDWEPANFM